MSKTEQPDESGPQADIASVLQTLEALRVLPQGGAYLPWHTGDGCREPTMARNVSFVYGSYRFLCSAVCDGPGLYRPVLVRRLRWPNRGKVSLLSDAVFCATEEEALRCAEAQAVKWVDNRTAHEMLQT